MLVPAVFWLYVLFHKVLSSEEEEDIGDSAAVVTATSKVGSSCAESIAESDPYQIWEEEVESFLTVLEMQAAPTSPLRSARTAGLSTEQLGEEVRTPER